MHTVVYTPRYNPPYASFAKPYAALAFEYHKVQANTGVPNLGAIIQFSLLPLVTSS